MRERERERECVRACVCVCGAKRGEERLRFSTKVEAKGRTFLTFQFLIDIKKSVHITDY